MEVRHYIAEQFRTLLATRAFVDALPGYLLPDASSQGRLPILLSRIKKMPNSGCRPATRNTHFQLDQLIFRWHGPSIRRTASRSAGADRSGEGSALGLDCSLEQTSIQSCPARVKQTLLS